MKTLKNALLALLSILATVIAITGIAAYFTESDIDQNCQRIVSLAQKTRAPPFDTAQIALLPQPVQRFVQFTFPNGIRTDIAAVEIDMKGLFRRPKTEPFNHTTAHQTFAVHVPALVFDALTSIIPLIWARAYDVYAQGDMKMKAKERWLKKFEQCDK